MNEKYYKMVMQNRQYTSLGTVFMDLYKHSGLYDVDFRRRRRMNENITTDKVLTQIRRDTVKRLDKERDIFAKIEIRKNEESAQLYEKHENLIEYIEESYDIAQQICNHVFGENFYDERLIKYGFISKVNTEQDRNRREDMELVMLEIVLDQRRIK